MVTKAPALVRLVAQLDSIAPARARAYDGILRDPRIGPDSDHHRGDAVDITHDPLHGIHAGVLAEEFVRQMRTATAGRLTYVIWNRRIASAKSGWIWRPYGRSCPHIKHVHLSIRHDMRNVTRPWTIRVR